MFVQEHDASMKLLLLKKKSHKIDTAVREKFLQGLINIPVNVQCSLMAAKFLVNCFKQKYFFESLFQNGKYRE